MYNKKSTTENYFLSYFIGCDSTSSFHGKGKAKTVEDNARASDVRGNVF
jgi:hypothetical protein